MAPFERRYTDAQRAAIVAEILEHGRTAPAAVARAAAGELAAGLEPFQMPVGTARDIAQQARRRRSLEEGAARGPAGAVRDAAATAGAVLARLAADLERDVTTHKAGPADVSALARAARDVLALERELARIPSSSPPADVQTPPAAPRGLVDELAAEGPRPEHT